MSNKVVLTILDGWGIGPNPKVDAIVQANTPCYDNLIKKYPHSTLITFGEDVGLPEGQMGNSEVGHLNIGAGRVVYQELARINKAIKDGTLAKNPVLIDAMQYAKEKNKAVHLMGLVSDGGVHSHINHVKALCDITQQHELEKVYIHAFTDGRDCPPNKGADFLRDLLQHIDQQTVQLASVIGRYYAMDRDKRWERIQLAYDLIVAGEGKKTRDVVADLLASYVEGVTDEFIKPLCCTDQNNEPVATIKPGDVVLCFNFRTDRPREITEALTQKDFPDYGMKKLDLHYVTMTRYDHTFKNVHVMFEKDDLKDTIGEVLASVGKTQVRMAETEKYPHVTFFFSGGREAAFEREKRIVIPSPKVATYDLQPEMSAIQVTDAVVEEIHQNQPDFICLNFANTDMVGHTGVFSAAIKAAETVDTCLDRLINTALEFDYQIIVIADHGNSDYMINDDGSPHTAHTKNPVPCIYVSNESTGKSLKPGRLADIAPTILSLMGIDQPALMTGKNLIIADKINE